MATMRAMEMQRPLLFASNDGITAIIGPDGRIESSAANACGICFKWYCTANYWSNAMDEKWIRASIIHHDFFTGASQVFITYRIHQ